MIKKFFRDHSIHKKIVPFLDEFFFLNPMNYFSSWLMICVGIYLNLFLSNLSPQFLISFNNNIFLLFIGLSSILTSFYIQNEISSNNKNDETFNFILEKYSISKIILFVKILAISGILILFFVSWLNVFIGLVLLLLNFLYNKYFKNKLIYYFFESLILFYLAFLNTFYLHL